jgi:glyoxylase I family protein
MTDSKGRPFQVGELDHVVIRCANQQRTLEFYTGVLGLVEERRLEKIGLIQLRAGQSIVDLIPAQSVSATGPNVDHFCLGVKAPDFDALIKYLREQGVALIGEPGMRYGARGMGVSIYIRDPEGNKVELKQMPD